MKIAVNVTKCHLKQVLLVIGNVESKCHLKQVLLVIGNVESKYSKHGYL